MQEEATFHPDISCSPLSTGLSVEDAERYVTVVVLDTMKCVELHSCCIYLHAAIFCSDD